MGIETKEFMKTYEALGFDTVETPTVVYSVMGLWLQCISLLTELS
jgi:hypothetical protein